MRMPAYPDLLYRIADSRLNGVDSVRDLPELTLEDLAAVLKHYPTAFMESIAEADPDVSTFCADRLGDTAKKVTERYSHIGLLVVGFVRAYVRGIVLRDVQALIERNREADALEDLGSHFPKTDEARELMTELGLGRLLS
jgi:hypothetical protein